MELTADAAEAAISEKDRFKVMVGGGPITADWADQVGADGYGVDAADAVEVAKRLVAGL